MKNYLILFTLFSLLLTSCSSFNGLLNQDIKDLESVAEEHETEIQTEDNSDELKNDAEDNSSLLIDDIKLVDLEDGTYINFTMNVHDFVFPEDSAEALNRIIDIHEEYDVPIDIYLNDPSFQYYVENTPDLIKRLKESEVVNIAYHYRPPYPYYNGFDNIDLADMNEEEMYKTIYEYETHAIDLETGLPTEEPGGFGYIADILGEAPIVAGINAKGDVANILGQVYAELGAIFTVEHGREITLGEEQFGLYIRPENYEIKLYEYVKTVEDGGEVIAEAIKDLEDKNGVNIIGSRWHENNFYVTNTPFWPIYWEESSKTTPLDPPYDLEAPYDEITYRSPKLKESYWNLYETAIKYVSENSDLITAISIGDLYTMN